MKTAMVVFALFLFSTSATANELCAVRIQDKDLQSIYVELMQPVKELSNGTGDAAEEFLISDLWYPLVEIADLIAMGAETVMPMRDKLAVDPKFVDDTAGNYFRKLRGIVDDAINQIAKHKSKIKTPAAVANIEKARQALVKLQAILSNCTGNPAE